MRKFYEIFMTLPLRGMKIYLFIMRYVYKKDVILISLNSYSVFTACGTRLDLMCLVFYKDRCVKNKVH